MDDKLKKKKRFIQRVNEIKRTMVTEKGFSSIFDYSSAFEYGPLDINMKSYKKNDYKSVFSYHAISIPFEEELERSTKEPPLSIILRKFIVFSFYLLAILLFPISFWICIKRVHSLERIVLLRLGKLQPVRGPGFAFILPCIDKWTRVSLRVQNMTLGTGELLTVDGGIVDAEFHFEYRVSDVLKYVLKLPNPEETLENLGLLCVTNVVSEKDQEDLKLKNEIVCCNIQDELNRSVINWGLEIIHVYLYDIQVLKAAEPVDVIGTIMTALKAATGNSTEHTAAMFPLIPDIIENKSEKEVPEELASTDTDINNQSDDCVNAIKKLADLARKEGYLKDLNASFRFDIVGRSTRRLLMSFKKGSITVYENVLSSVPSDVQLMLTEDNLKHFLNGEMSPLEAYMDGKVMVTGDWSLLRSLAKIFDLCKSKCLNA
ncbi:stomatin-like protein 1 [Trichonephila inaurata madagascariensis]|uniref:Stomatin-like protein 1 n=1 Tax=Trichonephila inaurata madagascariensis TaxID=2747483 RepID=A0A8X6XZ05_9ARAC|nr:stomatin-like protein 1 [Trichonephila inaurata madagascariensis]